ncbi:MAG: pilus assembly protein TadG-related protein [Candidatus Obscuribacterales bacterium]|jgi:hypothetical protein
MSYHSRDLAAKLPRIRMQTRNRRSEKGALSSVFLLALIFGLLILGSIAVDFVHGFHVRKQLQVAADSGALAGAYMLSAPMVSPFQQKKARDWAADMVARNASDNQPLIADGENVAVDVDINAIAMKYPHTCEVTITRQMPTIFARFVGFPSMPVSARAVGGAYCGLRTISPNQILPIGISSKASGGMLQLDPNKPKQNATWISGWNGMGNPSLDVGSSPLTINGNSDHALLSSLVGGTYFCAVVKASNDDGPLPKNQEVLGTTKITVKRVRGPNDIEVTVSGGGFLRGRPGFPNLPTASSNDLQFALNSQSWRILLIDK